MSVDSKALSDKARRAAQAGNWPVVADCAGRILKHDATHAEGHFLSGLAARAGKQPVEAVSAFRTALACDPERYDAAVELAVLYLGLQKHTQAFQMLEEYRDRLHNSPRYLDMAGTVYSNLGAPEKARPLFERANELQPDIHLFQANLAACCVHTGRLDRAKELYRRLLQRNPGHQRIHYQLSQLEKAGDDTHIKEMRAILEATKQPPDKNIFLYYAIGKELEDIGQWDDAFDCYRKAGDAITAMTNYDVARDETLIATIKDVCTPEWLRSAKLRQSPEQPGKTPIFIIGLPRTGTTLVERILSSHSQVESAGETHFIELAITRESGVTSARGMDSAIIEAAARVDINRIASTYLTEVQYLLGDKPFFIEKLPENMTYAGFIAKAFPDSRLVHVKREPMDACFALYKQSYFRFAYNLEDLARYYIAYDGLLRHWRKLLGDRLVEIAYEDLVANQEQETRALLSRLDLAFEPACLNFETNPIPSATASSVQVREKIHTGSVGKWRNFSKQLQPLRQKLEAAGITIS